MTKKPAADAQASLFALPDASPTPNDAEAASAAPLSTRGPHGDGGVDRVAASAQRPVPPIGVASPPHAFLQDAAAGLPRLVHLGTSSWSFPGWQGLLYDRAHSTSALAHGGLTAYAAHPLLRTVGLDRSFYAPLTVAEYRAYAAQVPSPFRFVVKAPAAVCDAAIRGTRGAPTRSNPDFLNADLAIETFIARCREGLGPHLGPMVFQLSPLPDAQLADPVALIDRLGRFFAALPSLDADARAQGACYALELRDASLLTPRLIRMLRTQRVRYCLGVHARMPDVGRQAAALALLDAPEMAPSAMTPRVDAVASPASVSSPTSAEETRSPLSPEPSPLIVRWNLHAGLRYEGAKTRYEPFDAIVDADIPTRHALAALILRYLAAGQSSFVIINNKAEGSSPLSCGWLASALAALCDASGPSRAE